MPATMAITARFPEAWQHVSGGGSNGRAADVSEREAPRVHEARERPHREEKPGRERVGLEDEGRIRHQHLLAPGG